MQSTWDLGLVTARLDEGVCWVQFNRPERLNVLSPEMLTDLETALSMCAGNAEVRVVVLTGGAKAFVAGNDVRSLASGGVTGAQRMATQVTDVQEKLANLGKPTIAAVAGYALGAGLELALCCDFRISADTGKFGLPEIRLGVIPGGGGTQRLPRLVGVAAATKLILLGATITAEEAERVGLVDRVVPLDTLDSEVRALALELAEQPPLALSAAKKAIGAAMNTPLAEGLVLEHGMFCMLFGTEDQREGMAAFLEKRRPSFMGQ